MNRIKFLREEKKLLQSDIAKILGISSAAVGNYENEKRDIPTHYLKILSEHFGVSIDYLLGKSDIRNPEKINIDEMDIAFASGIKGLNKENQEIAKNIIEGLLAKQKNEENKKEEK